MSCTVENKIMIMKKANTVLDISIENTFTSVKLKRQLHVDLT